MKRRRTRSQRGAILVLVALSLVLLVALAALAVDLGWVYVQEARLRKCVNAAAMAAAGKAAGGASTSMIRNAAKSFAAAGGVALADADIQVDPAGNCAGRVRIVHRESPGLFFSPLLGVFNMQIGYGVNALGMADATPLISDPPAALAASGVVPLYIPHADLLPVLDGRTTTSAQLAANIFGAGQQFAPGQTVLLKTGASFHTKLEAIVGMGSAAQQGACIFPGQGPGAAAYGQYLAQGYGSGVAAGDVLDTQTGTMQGPTAFAVSARVSQDPGATYAANGGTVQPFSARLVVVPIANAVQAGPDDAGTGVPGLRNVGYVWNGSLSVKVIGFAEVLLQPYDESYGRGVVTGVFVRYAGTPPSGQQAGGAR